MKALFVIAFCFLTYLTPLNGQIIADSISDMVSLLNHKDVKALRTNLETTFEEIQNESDWSAYDSTYTTTTDSAVWLKFQIENQSKDTIHKYLYSIDQYTTIFQQIDAGYKKFKNGAYVPLSQRANKSFDHFTKLSFPPFTQTQLYVRLSAYNIRFGSIIPAIYAEKAFWEYTWSDYNYQKNSIAFIYLYLISLLTIIVFTLVFWYWLYEKLYLFYLGYLFFQLIYGFIVLGKTLAPVGNFFLYNPKLAANLSEPVQFAFIGFYIFFILHLLTVKKYDKLLAKVLKYLGLTCFLYAILRFIFSYYFYNPELTLVIFNVVRLIILPINFILIIWILIKVRHPLLVYFIIGQSFFFVGALLASYLGSFTTEFPIAMLEFYQAPNIIFQIGLLAEVYCFSIALGQNVYILQKEKEKANRELIGQLQENQLLQKTMNRELDEKVSKKTSELIQLYSQLELEKEEKIKNAFSQKLKETEMIALRSQMNPHFIFNSLSAIKHLIMTSSNDAATEYLDDFSTLLRGILQNSNRQEITVEQELEILEVYLSLERNRMGPGFIYTIKVTSREALSQFSIPPLLLQPIVENAIWHGLQPSLKAKKELTVTFDTTDNLKIIIEDNGIGRKESAKKKKLHQSMGTSIVQDRISLFNHLNDYGIHYKITDLEENGNPMGTRITLTYQN